jgi:uncharacterized glyoxalase superfamily protein PhnB
MSTRDDEACGPYPSLTYEDATAAIAWLCRAFGFRQRLLVPGEDGAVMHSELSLGSAVVMVGSPRPEERRLAPRALAGLHQTLSVTVANPDAHHARAVAEGARILRPLQDEDYGSRGYMAEDPEGHVWYFGTYRPGAWWDGAEGSPSA